MGGKREEGWEGKKRKEEGRGKEREWKGKVGEGKGKVGEGKGKGRGEEGRGMMIPGAKGIDAPESKDCQDCKPTVKQTKTEGRDRRKMLNNSDGEARSGWLRLNTTDCVCIVLALDAVIDG